MVAFAVAVSAAVAWLANRTGPAQRQAAAPEVLPSAPLVTSTVVASAMDAAVAAAPPSALAASEPTEAELLAGLRARVDSQPAAALELARDAERRFPEGPTADERVLLKLQALVHLNQIAEARVEASAFLDRHPDSPWAARVVRLTGMHPRPRPPIP